MPNRLILSGFHPADLTEIRIFSILMTQFQPNLRMDDIWRPIALKLDQHQFNSPIHTAPKPCDCGDSSLRVSIPADAQSVTEDYPMRAGCNTQRLPPKTVSACRLHQCWSISVNREQPLFSHRPPSPIDHPAQSTTQPNRPPSPIDHEK